MSDRLADLEKAWLDRTRKPAPASHLKHSGGDGTFGGMDNHELHTRLTRLEGGWTTFQWAVGTVSALMIGAMAVIVAVQLSTQSQVGALGDKVDALPSQINQNLLELNRTLSSAISASKSNSQPNVIVVPAYNQAPSSPPTQSPP